MTRSITFGRTNRPFAGATYDRMPYSTANAVQTNQSRAYKDLDEGLRSTTSGITSSEATASAKTSSATLFAARSVRGLR